jgi:plasmid rolling circle replication initiator protein Rep
MEKKENPEALLLAESRPQGLVSLPDRLDRFARAKDRSLGMASYLTTFAASADSPKFQRLHASKSAGRLSSCGCWLTFRHYFSVDQLRLVAGQFCQQSKLCPLCSIRRGSRNMAVYLERFHSILAVKPLLKPFLVTFTVRNGLDLGERFAHLRKALKRCLDGRRQALSGNGRGDTLFSSFEAGIGAFEITNQGKGKGWHPHVHFIILAEEMPDQALLSREWLARTKDSFVVDVRPVSMENPVGGFCEVFKYAMKFQGLSFEHNWEAHWALRRKRLLVSFGDFYGVYEPESLEDEIPLDELPYIDMLFQYAAGTYLHKGTVHAVQGPAESGGTAAPSISSIRESA